MDYITSVTVNKEKHGIKSENDHSHGNKQLLDKVTSRYDDAEYVFKNGDFVKSEKVDKVDGKQLSTNDFTDQAKGVTDLFPYVEKSGIGENEKVTIATDPNVSYGLEIARDIISLYLNKGTFVNKNDLLAIFRPTGFAVQKYEKVTDENGEEEEVGSSAAIYPGSIKCITKDGVAHYLEKKENAENKGVPNGFAPLDSNGKVPDDFLYTNTTTKDVEVQATSVATCERASQSYIKNLELYGATTTDTTVAIFPFNVMVNNVNVVTLLPSTKNGTLIEYLGSFHYTRLDSTTEPSVYTDKIAYDDNGILAYYKNTVLYTLPKTGWTYLNKTTDNNSVDYFHFRYQTSSKGDLIYTYNKLMQNTCMGLKVVSGGEDITSFWEIADGSNTQFYNKDCVGIGTTNGIMSIWITVRLTLPVDTNSEGEAVLAKRAFESFMSKADFSIFGAAVNPTVEPLQQSAIDKFQTIQLPSGSSTVKILPDENNCDFKFEYSQVVNVSVDDVVNNHNSSLTAHSDIRTRLSKLEGRNNEIKRHWNFNDLLSLWGKFHSEWITDKGVCGKEITFPAGTNTYINIDCDPHKVVLLEFYGKTSDISNPPYLYVEFLDKNDNEIGVSYGGYILGESRCGFHRYGYVSPIGTVSARVWYRTGSTSVGTLSDCTISILDCMPRRGNDSGVIYDAHLGMLKVAPRNTMEGFELTKIAGFTSFVTNVQVTKDGVLVALHDNTIDATSNGTGDVSTMTYEQLQSYDFGSWYNDVYVGTKIPKLETVLQFASINGMNPIIRMKTEWKDTDGTIYMNLIYDLLKKYGLRGKATIKAFEYPILEKCYNIMGNDVDYIWSLETTELEEWVYESAKTFKGVLTLEPMEGITEASVAKLLALKRDNGINCSVYVANDSNKMKELLKQGITRFCTDTFSDIVFPMD